MSDETLDGGALRVLIVGGGIGGLTLAHALRRVGITPAVVERAASIKPVGAGIALGPNAMAIMHRFGVGARIVASGRAIHELRISDERGRLLQRLDLTDVSERFGSTTIALHRALLHEALLEPVRDLVRMDTTVTAVELRGRYVAVTLSNGSTAEYDLVVGADGIHSSVRRAVFPPVEIRYSGYTSWRFVVPQPCVLPDSVEMWGPGRRLGIVPIGNGLVYVFAVLNRPSGAPDAPADRLARLHTEFASFGGPVPALLRLVATPEQLIHADIEEVTVPSWVRGPVVLLGDAAHAMTPNLGQGAGMAIEDAAVLADRLASEPSIDRALAAYQDRRMPRVRWVQETSRRVGRLAQWGNPLAVALRSLLLRSLPDRVNEAPMKRLLAESPALREIPRRPEEAGTTPRA